MIVTQVLLNALNTMPVSSLNIVDVGCHAAILIDELKPNLRKPAYWIGIDPTDHNVGSRYDVFVNKAIEDVEFDTTASFTEYNDSFCNSLFKMNQNALTHDPNERNTKFFCERVIETPIKERIVQVTSLERVLDSIPKIENETLHYVKIDTQGNDIRVARSLKKYLDRTVFIQLECITTHNKGVVLYERQQLMEDDVEDMKKLGFTLFSMIDYQKVFGLSPEADAVFINNKCLE